MRLRPIFSNNLSNIAVYKESIQSQAIQTVFIIEQNLQTHFKLNPEELAIKKSPLTLYLVVKIALAIAKNPNHKKLLISLPACKIKMTPYYIY